MGAPGPGLSLAEVLEVLQACADALIDYSDIEDSEDGEDLSPRPNWAMALGQRVESAIEAVKVALGEESGR